MQTRKGTWWGKTVFDGTAVHCNARITRIRCMGGKNAWKKVKVFVFVLKYMVVTLHAHDRGRVFLESAAYSMGGRVR